jgi:hypothetical protein
MQKLAVDSNSLTCMVDVTTPGYDPRRDRSKVCAERVAMLRIELYMNSKDRIYVLPAVEEEYQRIPEEHRLFLHDNMILFSKRPVAI